MQEEKIKAALTKMHETWPYFYVKGADIPTMLQGVRAAIQDLEDLSKDPRNAERADLWKILGMGWCFLGNGDRAEAPLHTREDWAGALADYRKALDLAPSDWEDRSEIERVVVDPTRRLENKK